VPEVTIWTHAYAPEYEGTSKEILLLSRSLGYVSVHDLSDDLRFKIDRKLISYRSSVYPLRVIAPLLAMRTKISHVYISQPETFYLSFLKKRPVLVTYCGRLYSGSKPVEHQIERLKMVDHIVVESSRDLCHLRSLGFGPERASLVYPGIDLARFTPQETRPDSFKLLFASAPLADVDALFRARGVDLILHSLENLDGVQFVLLWRQKCTDLLYRRVKSNRATQRLTIVNKILGETSQLMSGVHAVVAPYTTTWANKACPSSLVEGLASGKPVLASNEVAIADLISREKCGVVFEPTTEGLVHATEHLRDHYQMYQANARRAAEKYFAAEDFVHAYERIYADVSARRA